MTARPVLLQTGPLLPSLEAGLAQAFDVHPLWQEADRAAFLAAQGARFDGIVTSARHGADAALVAALPNLKVIGSFGVGYETLDVAGAARRGIPVSNTPDVLTDCVADVAMGLTIDAMRGLSAADRFVRRGDWAAGKPVAITRRVSGKRMGIVGLGRIGKAIATRARGFGMDLRYHGRRAQPDAGMPYEASLVELARWCDVLMVAAAGGPSTRGLVDAAVLQALGPQGWLVNIARGPVIDEPALVAALTAGTIAGAGLDVYVDEPNVPTELFALDNVVLLPHVASGTVETRQAMADLVLANLTRFFTDGTLVTPIPTADVTRA